jgi:UDP-2,4-diacetamido-2,4,6-trideoxy-beta-L-altropyranose hydrolase
MSTKMKKQQLHIRRATNDDMMLYFAWANDADVRRNAFQQEPISLENHQHWFAKRLASPTSHLFVLEQDSIPVGQIRFDETEQNLFEIGYSIAQNMRGKGFGADLLEYGVTEIRAITPAPFRIFGRVKIENLASAKAFLRAGFLEDDTQTQEKSASVLRFVYSDHTT